MKCFFFVEMFLLFWTYLLLYVLNYAFWNVCRPVLYEKSYSVPKLQLFCIRLCQVYSIKADKKADRYLCELLWFTCKVLSAMKWMPGISRRASSYSAVRYLPSSLSSSILRYDW